MTALGIIGNGNIGAAIGRLAVAAKIPVIIANSRRPESLASPVAELGPLAAEGTTHEAAHQDFVVLSVPLTAHQDIPLPSYREKPSWTRATITRPGTGGSPSSLTTPSPPAN